MRSIARIGRLAAVMVLGLVAAGAAPIAGRAQVAPPLASFVDTVRGYDVTTIRRTFPAYNQGLFEMVFGAGPGIPLTTPAQEDLFSHQVVVTPAGQMLDVGHVITGLEAATAPTPTSRAIEQTSGCSMLAAVTWSGDVGKALHDYLADGGQGDPAAYFAREAPPEDLLGDVDGWVMGTESTGMQIDVADVLTTAYLAGDLESARFHRFAASLGGADKQGLTDAARQRIGDEIRCFAGALAALERTGVTPEAITAASPAFVDRLIAYVENGLAAEIGE